MLLEDFHIGFEETEFETEEKEVFTIKGKNKLPNNVSYILTTSLNSYSVLFKIF